jgi:diguanylate cyclase (GGDEF)-like protein
MPSAQGEPASTGLETTPEPRRFAGRRALTGAALAQGAPLGWIGVSWLTGRAPVDTIALEAGLLAYLALTTTVAFSSFGWVLGRFEEKLDRARADLERLSHVDALTGLGNVRVFADALDRFVSQAHRSSTPLTIALFDIDLFKQVNDRYGHLMGDEILTKVGAALARGRRREDVVARIGGEEFALLLPGIATDGAARAADRVLDEVRHISAQSGQETVRITVSAGVGALLPGESGRELFARADQALYTAKRAGRDCVQVSATP